MRRAEFLLLGPVEVRDGTGSVAIGGIRSRSVLSALLLDAGRVVSIDQIVDAAWGDHPPASARVQAQNRISVLRRLLRELHPDRPLISTSGSGYLITLDEDQLDMSRFTCGVERAAKTRDRETAHRELLAALALWRGPAMADLDTPYFQAVAQRWEEQRLRALERRVQLELELGRHGELVAELTGLVGAHPYRERFYALLMLTLYRAGRQADALDVYRQAREVLAEQLGLDPGKLLQRLHTTVLRGESPEISLDETEEPASVHGGQPVPRVPGPVTPRELPADIAGFTGRADHLGTLSGLLDEDARTIAVTGGAGMGKTALAVHWARSVADRFPDGQLYINLRAYAAGQPVRPIEALAQFLQTLGVPSNGIPIDVEAAAGMYRSALADKRVLVLLDDAGSGDDVRPLLPGSSGCLVLVTSRDRLSGLVALEGARRLTLDVLQPGEARSLLAWTIGTDRVEAEPQAAAELARLCAYLPLALRIAGANLVDREQSLASYTAKLREGNRVGELRVDGDEQAAARVAFDLSYVALPHAERRLFRSLGLVPGPDFTAEAVAALADVPPSEADRLLDRLARAHLVQQRAAGRYAFHDLLRLYATDRAQEEDGPDGRGAAIERLFDWYLSTVDNAGRLLSPDSLRLPQAEPDPLRPSSFTTHSEALSWLDAESANLLSAIRYAAEHGPRPLAWRLATALRGYWWLRGHEVAGVVVSQAALAAAEAEGDLHGQAAVRLILGMYDLLQGRYEPAIEHQEAALTLARQADWAEAQATALTHLGGLYRHLGQPRDAADHLAQALALNQGARMGHAHGQLGSVYWELGKLAKAVDHLTWSVLMYRTLGSLAGQAVALANLGEAYHMLGQFDRALEELDQALQLDRELGNHQNEMVTLCRIAAVHSDAGRHALALELSRAALALARDTNRPRYEAQALSTLAIVQHNLGRHAAAAELHRQVLSLITGTGDRYPMAHTFIELASAHAALGHHEFATRRARDGLDLAVKAGYRLLEGQALTVLADVYMRQSRQAEAAEHAGRALLIHRETGHQPGEKRTLAVMSQLVVSVT